MQLDERTASATVDLPGPGRGTENAGARPQARSLAPDVLEKAVRVHGGQFGSTVASKVQRGHLAGGIWIRQKTNPSQRKINVIFRKPWFHLRTHLLFQHGVLRGGIRTRETGGVQLMVAEGLLGRQKSFQRASIGGPRYLEYDIRK